MLIDFYPNPNKPKPVVHTPALVAGGGNGYQEFQARKMGVPLDEYIRRDAAVRAEASKANYFINDVVYPYNKVEYEKKGKCRILAINRTYGDLGKDYQWKDGEPIFCVHAASEKTNYSTFFATAGFFRKEEPTE